ncbi:MAG TPA: TIGR03619 family F420-dependent LLM class oxidoreductase [Candidatus Binatia bacterium]|nr:TIGR03619 family F420-dependent LLM class oxidoreductase [Candidatus Binatia bacterium]
MKYGLMFVNAGPLSQPDVFAHLAVTAERVGIESIWTVEHVLVPRGYQSTYPYSADGRMPAPEDAPIPDPFIALAYAAALTTKIKLATGVLILPQRHPAYVAKEAASIDLLSSGRMILGIGVGWLEEEFNSLGIPFEDRAARTRESVDAMRSLWSPGPSSFSGKYFSWKNVESNPKPVQSGGIPIVLGGHTDLAAKRAARYGNGFFPGRGGEKGLTHLLGVMREECQRVGTNADAIEITAAMMSPDHDFVKRQEDLGVNRLILAPPAFDKEGLTQGLEAFGNAFIARA